MKDICNQSLFFYILCQFMYFYFEKLEVSTMTMSWQQIYKLFFYILTLFKKKLLSLSKNNMHIPKVQYHNPLITDQNFRRSVYFFFLYQEEKNLSMVLFTGFIFLACLFMLLPFLLQFDFEG